MSNFDTVLYRSSKVLLVQGVSSLDAMPDTLSCCAVPPTSTCYFHKLYFEACPKPWQACPNHGGLPPEALSATRGHPGANAQVGQTQQSHPSDAHWAAGS